MAGRNLFILPLLSVALLSCAKYTTDNTIVNRVDSFVVSCYEEDETKVYSDGTDAFYFNANDKMSVFCSTENELYRFAGATGDNYGDFVKEDSSSPEASFSKYYAVYPYSDENKSESEGTVILRFPLTQHYAGNSIPADGFHMVSATSSLTDNKLKLKNVGGYLKLKFYASTDICIKKVVLRSNNAEPVSGVASVTIDSGGELSTAIITDARDSVILDFGEGQMLSKSSSSPTVMYLSLPPVTFTGGFTVTLTDTDGKSYAKSTSKAIMIKKNAVSTMSTIRVNSTIITAKPKVVAHRGHWRPSGSAQNSLKAAELAGKLGADGIECDLRVTSDGFVVLNHDDTWGGNKVSTSTLETIRTTKLANGENLPLFSEWLNVVKDYPSMTLFLEIKQGPVETIYELLKAASFPNDFYFISFTSSYLDAILGLDPSIKVQHLCSSYSIAGLLSKGYNGVFAYPYGNCPDLAGVDELHLNGLEVHTGTISTVAQYESLTDREVDWVTTDYPDYFIK